MPGEDLLESLISAGKESRYLSNLSEEALTSCWKRGYVLQINGIERSVAAFTRTMSSEPISSSNPSCDSPKQNINPSLPASGGDGRSVAK